MKDDDWDSLSDEAQEEINALTAERDAALKECERLKAEAQRLRGALELIDKQRPASFAPGREYWTWGNYDDCYQYGQDEAYDACANIARAALSGGGA